MVDENLIIGIILIIIFAFCAAVNPGGWGLW